MNWNKKVSQLVRVRASKLWSMVYGLWLLLSPPVYGPLLSLLVTSSYAY